MMSVFLLAFWLGICVEVGVDIVTTRYRLLIGLWMNFIVFNCQVVE